MASKCFMCGAAITRGILCERCDKPRKPKQPAPANAASEVIPPSPPVETPRASASLPAKPKAQPPPQQPQPSRESTAPRNSGQAAAATAMAPEPEPFPKAPLLPFPVESASPAITSIANVLMAAGAPAIVLSADRSVKFVTEEAKRLFRVPQSDLATVKQIETLSGARVGEPRPARRRA